jgi:hypothetical protein
MYVEDYIARGSLLVLKITTHQYLAKYTTLIRKGHSSNKILNTVSISFDE